MSAALPPPHTCSAPWPRPGSGSRFSCVTPRTRRGVTFQCCGGSTCRAWGDTMGASRAGWVHGDRLQLQGGQPRWPAAMPPTHNMRAAASRPQGAPTRSSPVSALACASCCSSVGGAGAAASCRRRCRRGCSSPPAAVRSTTELLAGGGSATAGRLAGGAALRLLLVPLPAPRPPAPALPPRRAGCAACRSSSSLSDSRSMTSAWSAAYGGAAARLREGPAAGVVGEGRRAAALLQGAVRSEAWASVQLSISAGSGRHRGVWKRPAGCAVGAVRRRARRPGHLPGPRPRANLTLAARGPGGGAGGMGGCRGPAVHQSEVRRAAPQPCSLTLPWIVCCATCGLLRNQADHSCCRHVNPSPAGARQLSPPAAGRPVLHCSVPMLLVLQRDHTIK